MNYYFLLSPKRNLHNLGVAHGKLLLSRNNHENDKSRVFRRYGPNAERVANPKMKVVFRYLLGKT